MGFRTGLVALTAALALVAPGASAAAADRIAPTLLGFHVDDGVVGPGDLLRIDYAFEDDSSTALSLVAFEFVDPEGRKRSLYGYKRPLTGSLSLVVPGDWVAGAYTLQNVYGADASLNLIQYTRDARTLITPAEAEGPSSHDFDIAASDLTVEARPPAAPTNVTARAGNGSVSVKWRAAPANGSPLTGYVVALEPGGHELVVPAPATTAEVDGLENGTSYTVVVRATNAIGTSPDSLPTPPVTPATIPDRAARPKVTVKAQRVIVRWQAPSNGGSRLTGYRVTLSGDTTRVPGSQRGLNQRLKPGRYRIRVAAVNGIGKGPASPAVTFRVRRDHWLPA